MGTAQLSITARGLRAVLRLARSISDQVLAPERRAGRCRARPGDAKVRDDACALAFIETTGEALFRRPLTESETAARVRTAGLGAERSGDFYQGLKLALTSLLVAPEFLFRIEKAEADPATPGQYRLDGYTKASRLSFLFWDAPPDAELRRAAAAGDLHTRRACAASWTAWPPRHACRTARAPSSPTCCSSTHFDGLTKDAAGLSEVQPGGGRQRPRTDAATASSTCWSRRSATTATSSPANDTFINRQLAAVYSVPFLSDQTWAPYTFPDEAERSGILTEVTFLSLFSHPAASSPTTRA